MSNEVYLVTRGEYSDYSICAIFSDKKLAEKYIELFKGNSEEELEEELRIETYKVNPYQYELKADYKPYFVRMTKEGNCIEIKIQDLSYAFESKDEDLDFGFDIHKNMYLSSFAKDEKDAIKIANEKRLQLIAENRWK